MLCVVLLRYVMRTPSSRARHAIWYDVVTLTSGHVSWMRRIRIVDS